MPPQEQQEPIASSLDLTKMGRANAGVPVPVTEVLLYVLIGPPGAGKTTYAQKTFPESAIVSGDDIRESLTRWRRDDPVATWKYVVPVRSEVGKAIARTIVGRLHRRLVTVYDNTNLLRRNRINLLKLVPEPIRVRYVVFDRPLDVKLAERGWRPAELIAGQHAAFQAELKHILAGDGFHFVEVEDRRDLGV